MTISHAELRAVLARYPVLSPDVRLVVAPDAAGFSGAGVVRIETSLGPVAVRRWPGGWPAERLRGLHRLLAHIGQQGVDVVAVPLRADHGDTLVEWAGTWWQVEPWLPGIADYHRQPSRARLSAAVQALAGWHCAAASFRSDAVGWFRPPSTGVCPALEERLQAIARLSPALLKDWQSRARRQVPEPLQPFPPRLAQGILRALPEVSAQLLSVKRDAVPLQICLRDVWHDHILYTGDQVTGLIDPSASRTDSVAVDLARLLGSLIEDRADDWAFALQEYSRQRPLTLVEERLIPIFDRSGVVLSAVTWLKWLGPDARQWPDLAPIIDRLERLTTRLERVNAPVRTLLRS